MGKGIDEFEIEGYGRRLAQNQSGGQGTLIVPEGLRFWKPKQANLASHTIEVIPYRVTNAINRFVKKFADPGRWYMERSYFKHYKIGVNRDSVVCPAKTFGRPCPICEERAKFQAFPDKESKDLAKALNYSERQLFLIYDLDDTASGVQLWDVAHFNFGAQLDAYISGARDKQKKAFQRFYHPTEGLTLRLTVKEKPMPNGMNYLYYVHEMYEREQPVPSKLYEHGYDLDAMIREVPYDTLKKIYSGLVDDVDDEKEEEEETQTRKPERREESERNHRNGTVDDDEPPAKPVNRTQSKPEPASKPTPKEVTKPAAKPAAEPHKFATGDKVRFERRGEDLEGIIKRVDMERETASIEVEGYDRPMTYDFRDLTLIEADDTFDLVKNSDKSSSGKSSGWDDDENEAERSFRPKSDEEDAAPPKPRGRPPGSKNRT